MARGLCTPAPIGHTPETVPPLFLHGPYGRPRYERGNARRGAIRPARIGGTEKSRYHGPLSGGCNAFVSRMLLPYPAPAITAGGLLRPGNGGPLCPGGHKGQVQYWHSTRGRGIHGGRGRRPVTGGARAGAMGPGREYIPFVKVPPDYSPPWGAGCPCNVRAISGAGRGARCRVGAPRRGVRYRVIPYYNGIVT